MTANLRYEMNVGRRKTYNMNEYRTTPNLQYGMNVGWRQVHNMEWM